MTIRRVAWLPFEIPFLAPFATAHGVDSVRRGLLLRLTADDGREGLGEASPLPAFGGGTLEDALSLVAGLAPALLGQSLDNADAALAAVPPATPASAAIACAVDTALCDLRAQQAGVPLAALLGNAAPQPVPVNATIGAPDLQAAAEAARRAVVAGFRCIKLKVGAAGLAQTGLERVAAVRAAVGPGVGLRLDANGAWTVEEAIAIIRGARRYGVELVEQPVADLEGLARVRAAVETPIAADECVGRLEQAREVVARGAADVLVVKPMLANGPRAARAILAMALEAGLGALVTTTMDAGVGVAMALHVAATLPHPRLACGLATGGLLAAGLVAEALPVVNGAMRLSNAPGLGMTLDERQVARYGGGWREVGG